MLAASIRSSVAIIALFFCIARVISNDVGRFVQRGEVGYVVQIKHAKGIADDIDGGFICTGTIISKRHVVSAAHWLPENPNPKDFRVVIAQVDLYPILEDEDGAHVKSRRVRRIFIHPEYVKGNFHADVAVLKLENDVGFGANTAKVGLCRKPLQADDDVSIYGWGRASFDSATEHVNELKELVVPVLPKEECSGEMDDLMFCAGLSDSNVACQADSGAPAIRNGEFCGFVVRGEGCGDNVGPGVYTDIMAVKDFIAESMDDGLV